MSQSDYLINLKEALVSEHAKTPAEAHALVLKYAKLVFRGFRTELSAQSIALLIESKELGYT